MTTCENCGRKYVSEHDEEIISLQKLGYNPKPSLSYGTCPSCEELQEQRIIREEVGDFVYGC